MWIRSWLQPRVQPVPSKSRQLSQRKISLPSGLHISCTSVTRNHYMHDFFPHRQQAYANCDLDHCPSPPAPYQPSKSKMVSQQAPRHVRLAKMAQEAQSIDSTVEQNPPSVTPVKVGKRRTSVDPKVLRQRATSPVVSPRIVPRSSSRSDVTEQEVVVKCQVRTRIPTPHGHVYLFLYHNNVDQKEHLAFVADSAQLASQPGDVAASNRPFIRSHTLDSVWRTGETEMERIVRGAYTGRLGPECQVPSSPSTSKAPLDDDSEPPMVRIHSECFTGETIGSQRCDCGEQLDEAFRLITTAGRGVVVYLRQEGRGIGLLEKMRAYNLQDMGHDTVTANLMLGHGADQRKYDVAGAILRDLSINRIRLLTNNPDKIEQIEKEGISVLERVAMVPRSWAPPLKPQNGRRKRRPIMSGSALLELAMTSRTHHAHADSEEAFDTEEDDDASESYDDEDDRATHSSGESEEAFSKRRAGVGMIGGSSTQSPELEKYLRTKIERMGHMIDLPRHHTSSPLSIQDSSAPQSQAATRPASPAFRKHAKRPSATPHPLAASTASVLTQRDHSE